jgi:phosphate transport system permease protein
MSVGNSKAIVLRRQIVNATVLVLATAATVFGLVWLVWILWTTISKGAAGLTPSLFTHSTMGPESDGGLLNAFVGTLIMVGVGTAIAIPIGVLAGTYLAEFARKTRFGFVVRFMNDILLSAPSIVIGVFINAMLIPHIFGYSGIAGAITLAVILLPIIVRTSDEALQLVPGSLREAGLALGLPLWKVNGNIILRAASTGVITGALLGVARIAGETAPLIFTAFGNQYWNVNLGKAMASVPQVIFNYAASPYESWQTQAWAGALVLTLFVLLLGIGVRLIFKRGTAG